jgi:hypothetical protein
MNRPSQFSVSSVKSDAPRSGKIKYALAAWLLGLPLPIIIIALFVRGCDW